MGSVTARFISAFRSWDRSSQMAAALALLILIVDFLVLVFGPYSLRQPAAIGFFGVLVILQLIILWANRGMVTPYTQAQRYYLDENFEAARSILEQVVERGKADARVMTLLGNTYRQLGELSQSEQILNEALRRQPNHHFPLYGLGRTLLVQGRYDEAHKIIQQALNAGAPAIVQLDRAEASYRLGAVDEARDAARLALATASEAHRRLMAHYLLYRLGHSDELDEEVVRAGLSYWQAAAERFQHTPYGEDLDEDIRVMHSFWGD